MHGSSPRVRGTVETALFNPRVARFIPARAGNGHRRWRCGRRSAVHPRACGERASEIARASEWFGSSPRVRGTDDGASGVGRRRRFIPARAGNGAQARAGRVRWSVHPRACGERCKKSWTGNEVAGSSPRVRGTDHEPEGSVFDLRFIPARAGNGSGVCVLENANAVHPRACGERIHNDRDQL